MQFIDSARFMASSLSNHVNNLADGIHKIRCTYRHDNKKYETWGVKYKDCKCCLEYAIVKNSVIEYKFLCCNWKYRKTIDENLKKFRDTYKFKFILFPRKGIYLDECMDAWEKFNKTSLRERNRFLQSLKHGRCCWWRLHERKKSL